MLKANQFFLLAAKDLSPTPELDHEATEAAAEGE